MNTGKRWGSLLAAAVLAIVLPASAAQAGLVAYYDFEEGGGTTINDQSGNSRTGTYQNLDGSSWVAGRIGSHAINLNGSTQWVSTVSTFANQMGMDGNNPKSVSLWVNTSDWNNKGAFDLGQFGADGQHFNLRTLDGTTDRWRAQFWGGPDFDFNTPGASGNWAHMVLVHDGSEGRAYFNGTLVGSKASTLNTNNARAFEIGRYAGAGNFNGQVDEVAVYNHALAPHEVAYLANAGDPTALPPAPVVYDFTSRTIDYEGWSTLHGGVYWQSGDGNGVTPADGNGNRAHDGGHQTFLFQSPEFKMTGQTFDGVNALTVTFAGGAGDQNSAGVIFNDPGAVVTYNGGNSNSNGQKGLAFYNVATGQYDATIFENDNGGTNTRTFTPADLTTLGVNPAATYRLHYFENDDGGWGWGQLNSLQLAAEESARPAVYTSNFAFLDSQGWSTLNGGAHFRSGDGRGMTPADGTGGFAGDADHNTFLVQSGEFKMTGQTIDGTNALVVTFAGGAGDQDGAGVMFATPADVLAFNSGNSNSNGQKGLAFYNVATGQYDATIFENDNGGANTRRFTPADLTALGVDLGGTYRLHYFENDEGGWGWGQLNYVQVAGEESPAGAPPMGGKGYFGIREVKYSGTISNLDDAEAALQSGGGKIYDGTARTINFRDPDNGGSGDVGGDSPYLSNSAETDDNDFIQYAQGIIRVTDPGTYTFYARGDDGFRLRIEGQNFTSVSDSGDGTAVIVGDVMENNALGGNVNGFGVVDLAAGDYNVQYLFFERSGGSYNELFAAKGAKTSFDADFLLVGELKTAGKILNQPGGWQVVAIYDGANNLTAAIQDVEDYWNNGTGTNVFTATASTINYEDPNSGGGGHGFAKIPFPGENPLADDNNFAVGALAQLQIVDPGTYTFMILGDDGSRFRLLGTDSLTWSAFGGSSPTALADGFQLNGCCSDGFGVVYDLPAGTYDVELIWNEIGGGAYVGLWGAFGEHNAFDANVFQLLGENIRVAGLQLVGVPEPATMVLFSLGAVGLLLFGRRRRR